jgi:hypothetical protein
MFFLHMSTLFLEGMLMDGSSETIYAPPSAQIVAVKQAFSQLCGIPHYHMLLFAEGEDEPLFGGRVLQDLVLGMDVEKEDAVANIFIVQTGGAKAVLEEL